ncbi:MAG: DUF4412 domain-containing protein [Terriglobales bacterium]
MKIRRFALATIVTSFLAITALAQIPTGIPQFSADMKSTGRGGPGGAMNGKIYFGDKKMRFDMNMGGREQFMIHDMASQTSYMVMPQQKMYMEFNSAMGRGRGPGARMNDIKPVDPSNPCAADPNYTCKKEGTEEVNGRSCDKWVFTNKSNPSDTRTVWVDQKLHFPIKTQSTEGDTWELTNIQEGSQPASLFEVPSGYQKMDMGGMMGRRPQD